MTQTSCNRNSKIDKDNNFIWDRLNAWTPRDYLKVLSQAYLLESLKGEFRGLLIKTNQFTSVQLKETH